MKKEDHNGRNQVKAIILEEIVRSSCTRAKLKSKRFTSPKGRVGPKSIDYHIARGKNSLINMHILAEKNSEIILTLNNPDVLIKTANILMHHPEKGDTVRKSIDSAFSTCFVSYFGDGLSQMEEMYSHPEAGREPVKIRVMPCVIDNPVSQPLIYFNTHEDGIPDKKEESDLDFVLKVRGKMEPEGKINYILAVMGNLREIKKHKNSSQPFYLSDIMLWNVSQDYVNHLASLYVNTYKDLVQEFFEYIIRRPLIGISPDFYTNFKEIGSFFGLKEYMVMIEGIFSMLLHMNPFIENQKKVRMIEGFNKYILGVFMRDSGPNLE